jgi:hypothetical protein
MSVDIDIKGNNITITVTVVTNVTFPKSALEECTVKEIVLPRLELDIEEDIVPALKLIGGDI